MSQCDRCKKEITEMNITSEQPYDGGTLLVTGVPVQKYDCEEQMLLGDGAIMAGYARLLADRNVVGKSRFRLRSCNKNLRCRIFYRKARTEPTRTDCR